MNLSVLELAEFLSGRIVAGDPQRGLSGFASLDEAIGEDIAFFAQESYRSKLGHTRAGAVLVPSGFDGSVPDGVAIVAVEDPSLAFSALVERYAPPRPKSISGIHSTATVDSTAKIGADVCIGSNAVVGAHVVVGDRTEIGAGAVIGERVAIGNDCIIHPNSTIAWGCRVGHRVVLHSGSVIGADGFGYDVVEGRHHKVEQLGITLPL